MNLPASILFLADASDSPVSWLSLIVAASALVILVVQHFRPNPPNHDRFARREEVSAIASKIDTHVQHTAHLVNRDEMGKLENKLDQLLRDQNAHYEKIMEAGSIRARTMYQKIDGVSEKVEGLTDRVSHLEGRIGVETYGKD